MSMHAARPTDPLADTDRLLVDGTNLLHALSRAPAAPRRASALIGRLRGVVPAVGRDRARLRRAGRARAAQRADRVRAASSATAVARTADAVILSLVDEIRAVDGAGGDGGDPGRHRRPRPAPRLRMRGAPGRPARPGCSAGSTASGAAGRRRSASREPPQPPTKPRPVAARAVGATTTRRDDRPLGSRARRDDKKGNPRKAPRSAGRDGPRRLLGCGREHRRHAQRDLDRRSSTSRRCSSCPIGAALIGLLPVLIFLGVVGPFLTFTVLGSVVYLARKPRVKVTFEEGPRLAELDAGGAARLPGRASPTAAATRWSIRPGIDPLRDLPGRARGDLPDVRPRPRRRSSTPAPTAASSSRSSPARGRGPRHARAEARRRGGGLSRADRSRSVRPALFSRRRPPRRARVRGARRATP